MEAKKAPGLVSRMFGTGEVSLLDTKTGYRYSLVAYCPKDGDYSYVDRVDRFEKAGKSLKTVTFKCPTCSTTFEVPKTKIMVI
ncbi:hypothetical protein DEALK_11520 [Dehalogenimonas alkenigignens]|uniref:Uncharacterized protein n=1 Tax=Dehalogenimonas alkenigignens TaxID=1217799 RepID=A0A0W0GID3_9CHLR|nr:hypothetical protein [Dehalogenimonas alkenigignens]KTB48306.1 hypothetical protein DEALK_11520 [Dehalogenimonas alkenigignens]